MRDVDQRAPVEHVLAVHDPRPRQVLDGARRGLQRGLRQGEAGDVALVPPRVVVVVVLLVVVVVLVLAGPEDLQAAARQSRGSLSPRRTETEALVQGHGHVRPTHLVGRGAQVEAQHLHVPGYRVVARLLRVPDGRGDAVRRPHHSLGVRLLGRHQLIRLRANMRAGPGR